MRRTTSCGRIAQACYGVWFYIDKTLLPFDLVAVYPPPRDMNWLVPRFVWRIVGTLAISGRRVPAAAAPAGIAGRVAQSTWSMLAPNSGIIPFSGQIAADRYSYMATLGWVPVAAAFFCWLWQTSLRAHPRAMGSTALGLGLLVALIPMTWDQCRIWRSSESLWTHASEPRGRLDSSLAHYNMAIVLYTQGKLDEAAAHTALAIELNPGDVTVQNFLGIVLQRQGSLDAAAAQFARTLRLNPDYRDAHYNLGVILSRQGKFQEAVVQYADVLRLDPGFADAHHNLGIDFSVQGNLPEAEAHYSEALRLNPGRVDTHTQLGMVLSRQGKLKEASAQFAEAPARSGLRPCSAKPRNEPRAPAEARPGRGALGILPGAGSARRARTSNLERDPTGAHSDARAAAAEHSFPQPRRTLPSGLVDAGLALVAGGILRSVWIGDMEWKHDERWTYQMSQEVGRSRPWPAVGMPTSLGFSNPGLSLWIFVPIGRMAGTPTSMARAIVFLNMIGLVGFACAVRAYLPAQEREPWIWGLSLHAVSPFAIRLSRKIWPPSILTPLLLLLWMRIGTVSRAGGRLAGDSWVH